MSALRPALADIVARGNEHAPYFSTLLSSKSGLQIVVDNREERITERPPTAGTVLSAYDGATLYERAVSGFGKAYVEKAANDLVQGIHFEKYTAPNGPEHRGEFVTSMKIDPMALSVQDKLDRCRELHKRVKDRDQRIVNVRVIYLEGNEYSVFANRSSDLAQRVQRVGLYLLVVAAGPDGQVRYDLVSKAGTGGTRACAAQPGQLRPGGYGRCHGAYELQLHDRGFDQLGPPEQWHLELHGQLLRFQRSRAGRRQWPAVSVGKRSARAVFRFW
jgi:hypothetical protein